MTISDIVTQYGAYYKKGSQNEARIFQQLRAATKTTDALTVVATDDTIWQAAQATMTRVLQPFQKAFTPIDGLTITPEEIRMYKLKVDVEDYPDDLEATWLGFLAGNGTDRKEWPFIRWYLEQQIIPQAKQDEEINEIFYGDYAAPTPGTAGSAGTAMKGLRKLILNHINSGRITPITTGALSSNLTTFVAQIEDFADDINTKYWGIPMQLNMSEQNARKFFRAYRAKYGMDTDYKGGKGEVPFTNLTVNGLPSMVGSDGIWCTPKANAVKLIKKTENINGFQIESVDRKVKMFSDWWTGVGFIIPEIVFVNDQFDEFGS